MNRPVELPANQPKQFYRGGEAIAKLRGFDEATEFGPEDWVASTTTLYGRDLAGLSTLPDGRLLRDAVRADPESWLGADHVKIFGADTALLVKLLDAGQRLPVHCHPSNAFASKHLNCRHGKTESWIVVGTQGADPTVYIGFRDNVSAETVANWVSTQNTAAMLEALNPVRVKAGDTVFVPAGLPHAIGEGVFIVELQQPTDFSVTLEWQGFLANADIGHLGLGYDTALDCVDRTGWGANLGSLVRETGGMTTSSVNLFSADADPFFQADRLHVDGSFGLEPSFAVLVVLEGSGTLGSLPVQKGSTVVVPHAAGETGLVGDLVAIRCRPPLLSSVEGSSSE
ncbi:mannose-6-phosphate isomerase [Lentzea sp. NBRC 105346]|uniref:class I mannose-6-phosphate isomerase n=1 Tax=Lentzea sp. NBRC 105346 TaxID=3032205 RepID=UPI0024A333D4|nr:class I mannose-6-phosphate isomerase [Lentzea sp. NBRC 105346]GLZ30261.1 mannose-6-phosphate isomerase [Lentzea sp. NBRC 105346]